ncbi:MAG: YraN family protein [Paenibacillaceae bacterium ZCTH02-B3]|nr:MAG: YraN family protein [Paenibacillaceae bacterium ZCTH02-B3]
MNDRRPVTGDREAKRKDRRKERGAAAEEAAARHLEALGYQVLERNWRCRSGEIDLIARDGEALVFVEVRSRRAGSRFGAAVEAVTPRKIRQVRGLAGIYLAFHPHMAGPFRFDVVAVTLHPDDSVADLRHVKAAF